MRFSVAGVQPRPRGSKSMSAVLVRVWDTLLDLSIIDKKLGWTSAFDGAGILTWVPARLFSESSALFILLF